MVCDLFPQVESHLCCRAELGLVFIGILALDPLLADGGRTVNWKTVFQNSSHTKKAVNKFVPHSLTLIGLLLMFGGVFLIYGMLFRFTDLVLLFIWFVFPAILLGFLVVIVLLCECVINSKCFLAQTDWISASAYILCGIGYLIYWYFNLGVANTFVEKQDLIV